MTSNNVEKKNAFVRHFNFLSDKLGNFTDIEWKWNEDGTCFSNVDRTNFPILNEIQDDEFLDLKNSINNYEDVVYANRDYKKADDTRKVYCSHLINHLLKARSILKKNNTRVSEHGDKISGIRDQGFHKCRAMVIVPTRYSALQVVNCLRSFLPEHKLTKKWKEFLRDFNEKVDDDDDNESAEKLDESDDEEDEDDEETAIGKELLKKINENIKLSKAKHAVKRKGIDFDEWQLGNTNERFVFGICVEKKLFEINTSFANSDIVIGSPMGLKEILQDKKNYINQIPMTSSIEVLVMDQVEYMMMQNFDNLFCVLEKLNKKPRGGGECVKKMNSTLRIYEWALDEQAQKYRQNIVISAILHPFIKKLMFYFQNYQGTCIYLPQPKYVKSDLLLFAERLCKSSEPVAKKQKVLPNSNLKFERIMFSVPVPHQCEDIDMRSTVILNDVSPADSRLSLFKRKVVPILVNKLTRGVLIYFTQTIDLYNVQDVLKSENLSIAVISEDQDESNIASILTLFAKGAIKFVLLSERYYALTRQRISAAQHLIYYSTPTFPKFSRDFHEFLMHNSKATNENPHHIINLCEDELFEQINSQLAFKILYGQ